MRLDLVATQLSSEELLRTVKRVSLLEKKIQYQFLCYLSEVDRRKLYVKEGYPSLYAFLTGYLGYSESSALKRSQIVRKAEKLPELYYAIQDGRLSLSAASRLCPYLSSDNFETLVSRCERHSVREVERVIAEHFPKSPPEDHMHQRATPLSIDQVLIRFSANTQFEEKLKQALSLLSHKYPEGRYADVLEEALDLLIKKLNPQPKPRLTIKTNPQERVLDSRDIPRGIRTTIWQRDEGQCCYIGPSGNRCTATRFLHIDHIQPWVLGGSSHNSDNLRLLCAEHNRLRAKESFEWGQRSVEVS